MGSYKVDATLLLMTGARRGRYDPLPTYRTTRRGCTGGGLHTVGRLECAAHLKGRVRRACLAMGFVFLLRRSADGSLLLACLALPLGLGLFFLPAPAWLAGRE